MTTVATSPVTSANTMYPMVSPSHTSRRSAQPHIAGELSPEQLLFLTNFIKETAFYIEQLESYVGEYLDEFWEDREYAYHLTTDLLIDTLQQPLEERG
jgi:hypothetical protein